MEQEYIYVDSLNLKPELKVKRIDSENGRKNFYQFHMENNQWVSGGSNKQLAPYKYENWKDREEAIFIVEGEKCADELLKKGLCATTIPGGSNNWKPYFADFFKDRDVVIMPDNDSAGNKYKEAICADISMLTKSIKIIHLPHLESGGDVFDFLQSYTIEDLLKIVKETAAEKLTKGISMKESLSTEYPLNTLPPLIEECYQVFSKSSDGNKIGLATAVFAIISALIGRSYVFQNNFLNNYYVLVGPSGYARKTTFQKFALKLLHAVMNLRPDLYLGFV